MFFFFTFQNWENLTWYWGKKVAIFDWEWGRNSAPRDGQKSPDPSIYTIDHPDLNVSNFMGNSIGIKRAKPQHNNYLVHGILVNITFICAKVTHAVVSSWT